jgi:mono/diheme cytochrome c family protein
MGLLGGLQSGRRFSDAVPSIAPFDNRRHLRAPLALILLALVFSTYTVADSGADIYKAKCPACHGAHGAGDTKLGQSLNLRSLGSADVQKQSDDELFAIISRGKNRMPSYDRKLSKDQIRDVVRYIRTLKK